jgi:branched-chain amino acid aminotransferase
MSQKLNWEELGFDYIKTDKRYVSVWKDGSWDDGELVEDNFLRVSESAAGLHYGQQCFEGLKAYRTKDGHIQMFRPDQNAKRLQRSCEKILIPEISVEKFLDACEQVIMANEEYVPPYGTGASLYIRPLVFGTGGKIGLGPATEYIFCIFCMPVGAYFKGGMTPVNFITTEYDRAAPLGTGDSKVGGNYAASLKSHMEAIEAGYADCIYLDATTHTKIEEVGAANFFGITKDNVFVTPISPSILPGITKNSLLYLAENYMHMKVEERDVEIDNIDEFKEAGACGTAAVISPIGAISHKGVEHVFYSETEVGPVTRELYETLTGIQIGDVEAPEGWLHIVK